MAEILVLPVRSGGFDEATRLGEGLAAAYGRGQHLGSRALHIQAGGERLIEMGHQLELLIDKIGKDLTPFGVEMQIEDLRRMLGLIKRLGSMAQQFPVRA